MNLSVFEKLDRHWRSVVIALWLIFCGVSLYQGGNAIRWFALSDTDDNMRIMQVRALLDGQNWFDLRQYRLNPPYGADIHWSRIVDLPIALIKLALSPLIGGPQAERAAVALAPLIPMLVAFYALAASARRLLAPGAFLFAILLAYSAASLKGYWAPLRIDHHGWQVAMLAVMMFGLVDRHKLRGGILVGFATSVSLAIGLEMLIYLAAAGALIGLMWIRTPDEAPRLLGYGVSLGGGTALLFLLFTSYANRVPVCDAMSPVWLSMMLVAAAMAILLSRLSPSSIWVRLLAAGIAGAGLAAAYVIAWPGCLGRLEGSSPELEQMWLNRVREAMPIYRHGWKTTINSLTLPVMGLVGYGAMIWRTRKQGDEWTYWTALTILAVLPCLLLLWQTRASGAAQMMAVPGATALAWLVTTWLLAKTNIVVRVAGILLAFAIFSGTIGQYLASLIPDKKPSAATIAVRQAARKCPALSSLRPIALLPKGTVLTHVDLGPRLISVTHHDAIAGPYHRNQADILAVMRAFRGTAEAAHRTVRSRQVDYVLVCPNLAESTVYRADAPNGFYTQLVRGRVPDWLEPIALPRNSPYRMWRVIR